MTDQLFYNAGEVPRLVTDPLGDTPLVELNFSSNFFGRYMPIEDSTIINNTDRVSVHSLIRAAYGGDFNAFSHTVRLLPALEPFPIEDVNHDGAVNFLDISPFIGLLSTRSFQSEADIDQSGTVNFLDIAPFVAMLSQQ